MLDEKAGCLRQIDEMFKELDQARPFLRPELARELDTRFRWLREFALVARALDESLWRYRYLRHQAALLTTEPEQMKYLARAFDTVTEHQKLLFQFDAGQTMSCYELPLDQLRRRPGLGDPLPLMRQLCQQSLYYVETAAGPDSVPADWRR